MTVVRTLILQDTYRDSVFLMKLSSQARTETGAAQVSAMMGTVRNKELFERSGLSTPEVRAARPDDLVIAVEVDEAGAEAALARVEELLNEAPSRPTAGSCGPETPSSLEAALAADKALNLALVSVAGDYGRYEAAKAVAAGLDVMLYSDNISLEDEIALKQLARRKGRMVMGPDCGTAILDGVPLAFANAVRRGGVGIVGASGTGIQELTCLLDRFGVGVSQVYGTGGRDLKDEVGGITALAGLERLAADPLTRIVAVIGKPPGNRTRARLAETFRGLGKPVYVHYLGAEDAAPERAAGALAAADLTELATLIAAVERPEADPAAVLGADPVVPRGRPGWLRGLFGGGTLCQEAAELAAPLLVGEKYANLAIRGFHRLTGSEPSRGHCFWDFGEDEFTVGRPHPMMAPELKMEHLVRELCDPDVAVVLMDMVIGYGSHPDQAALIVRALEEAERASHGASREKRVILSVCGTDADQPDRAGQVRVLEQAGILVLGSNARAAVFAARATKGEDNG